MLTTTTNLAKRFARSIISWSYRIIRFSRHRLLTQKKNLLLIGNPKTQLYSKFYSLVQKNWQVVRIIQGQNQSDFFPIKDKTDEDNKSQESALKISKTQSQKASASCEIYLNNHNYQKIQAQIIGRQFDAIIVFPQIQEKIPKITLQNLNFPYNFVSLYEDQIMRNIFAYRLASQCLTSSGVFILSVSQSDFLKETNTILKDNILEGLVDAQITYLGVIIGDRDYTDLNSWSIVAASKEMSHEQVNFVAQSYKYWADSQNLPMPGSFALFRRKSPTSKSHFIEYL